MEPNRASRVSNSLRSSEDLQYISIFLNICLRDFLSDYNTIYSTGDSIDDIIVSLQDSAKKVFQWFNQVKGNTSKYLLLSKCWRTQLETGGSLIKNSTSEKLLGDKIDNKLSSDEHVKNCKKTNNKLKTLHYIWKTLCLYMDIVKCKIVFNAFFNAQFYYCPLKWIHYSRCNNSKISYLHEKCLQLIYNDKCSS